MSLRTAQTITADVREKLDEIPDNDALFVTGTDNTDLDTIIEGHITEAVKFCIDHADLSLLEPNIIRERRGEPQDTMAIWNYVGSGKIKNAPEGAEVWVAYCDLPEDFYRFCWAKCDAWGKTVTDAVYIGDPDTAKLNNYFTTGSIERPVVYIEQETQGAYKAHLYACQEDSTIELAAMKLPKWETEKIDIGDRLYPSVIIYLAGLTLATMRDTHADALFGQALAMMGVRVNQENTNNVAHNN